VIAPGAWLGLLGGGQLGRMFCTAAQSMGYKVAVLDPGAASPAGSVADRHIHADYRDEAGLSALAGLVRAATTEFENVPASSLEYLGSRIRVTPAAASVAIAQDRIREKGFLSSNGFAVAPYAFLQSEDGARHVDPALVPGIVKSARMGYDGKGQVRVKSATDVLAAFAAMQGKPCVIEQFVSLATEISVIVARRDGSDSLTWPVCENQHRDGILDTTIVPARIPAELAAKARRIALAVADKLDYRGVLCVEMFVLTDGRLLVNEIAPRPHNSGHFSIDACVTSQFEQQVRVVAELPLGDPLQHMSAVMVNLLGDIWYADAASKTQREPDWRGVLAHPRAKLHLYGKAEARRARKMGHVTCLGTGLDQALEVARDIKVLFGIPGEHNA
jgi:5-(carboxyamino)imidazole ribonucleotide synthase